MQPDDKNTRRADHLNLFGISSAQPEHQTQVVNTLPSSKCAKRIAKLLRQSKGHTMHQLQHTSDLTAMECRAAIQEIIKEGGEIEVLANDPHGRPILRLDN